MQNQWLSRERHGQVWFGCLGSPLRHSCPRPSPSESPTTTFRPRSPLLRARPPQHHASPQRTSAHASIFNRNENKHSDTRSHTYENMRLCERNGVCKERTCAIVRSGARRPGARCCRSRSAARAAPRTNGGAGEKWRRAAERCRQVRDATRAGEFVDAWTHRHWLIQY